MRPISATVRDALAIRRYERREWSADGVRCFTAPAKALQALRGADVHWFYELAPDWRRVAGVRSFVPDPPARLP